MPHGLSDAELLELVEAALRGAGPLDRLVTRAIFGGDPPRMWRDWPPPARRPWDRALRLHANRVRREERRPPATEHQERCGSRGRPRDESITLELTWDVFELAAGTVVGEERVTWWSVPGMRWDHLAAASS